MEGCERGNPEWMNARALVQKERFGPALQAFKRGLISMNEGLRHMLESSADCEPWLLYYAERLEAKVSVPPPCPALIKYKPAGRVLTHPLVVSPYTSLHVMRRRAPSRPSASGVAK